MAYSLYLVFLLRYCLDTVLFAPYGAMDTVLVSHLGVYGSIPLFGSDFFRLKFTSDHQYLSCRNNSGYNNDSCAIV